MSVNKSRELVISSLFILLLAFCMMLTSSFAKAVSFVGEDGDVVDYMEPVNTERDYPEDGSERDYPEDGARDYPEDAQRDYPEDGLGLEKNGPTFDMEEEEEGKVYIYSDVSVLDMKVGETKSINFSVSPWRTLLKFSAKTDNININIKDYFTFKSKKNPKGYTISVTAKKATEDLELYVIAKVKNDPTTMKKVAINISNIVKSNYAAFPDETIRKSDLILSKDLINSITMKSNTSDLIVDGDIVYVRRQMKTGTISYYLNKKIIGSTTITPVGFKSDNYTINAKKVDTVPLWTYTVPNPDIEYHFTIKDQEMGIMDSDMLTPYKNGDIVVTAKVKRLSDGKTFEDKAIFTIKGFDEISRLRIDPAKWTLKMKPNTYVKKEFNCVYSKKYKNATIEWSIEKSKLNEVDFEKVNEDQPNKIIVEAAGDYEEKLMVTVRLFDEDNKLVSTASSILHLKV